MILVEGSAIPVFVNGQQLELTRPGFYRSGHPFWKCVDLVAAWPKFGKICPVFWRWNFVGGKRNEDIADLCSSCSYNIPLESTDNRVPGNSSRRYEYAVNSMHECLWIWDDHTSWNADFCLCHLSVFLGLAELCRHLQLNQVSCSKYIHQEKTWNTSTQG